MADFDTRLDTTLVTGREKGAPQMSAHARWKKNEEDATPVERHRDASRRARIVFFFFPANYTLDTLVILLWHETSGRVEKNFFLNIG